MLTSGNIKIMKVCGNENVGFTEENVNTEVNLFEIIVGGDDVPERGCDPDITCKDILTVVGDVCNDTTSAEDHGKDDISMKVHIDKTDLSKVSRLRVYLENKRKNILWILFVVVGTLLTLRTVR
jgi:hypothetical protein